MVCGMTIVDVRQGDCLDVLKSLPDSSVDAVITDPPYGLSNTKPQQVADVLKAWVTGDTKVVPGLKKDSLEDAFVKALKRSTVTDSDDLDSETGKEFVAFRVPLGVIPVSMFRAVDFNNNPLGGEEEVNCDGTIFKVEHLLRNDGDTEGGECISGNIFRLGRRSNAPCSVTREGDSTRIRVSVWLGDDSFTESEGSSGVMAGGATEVVAVLSLDAGRGTAEFLPTDSALPGDFILKRSGAEPVGALTRTGGLPSMLESGEVSEVDASADGAGSLDVVVGLPVGWHESHSSTSKGFMGASWDGFVPPPAVWEECMRVLKPGGHMAVFAGARTQDLMGLSIRLAGFEIRDTLGWVYGSGFPKSHDIGKAIDKAAGAEREVVGRTKTPFKVDAAAHRGTSLQGSVNGDFSKQVDENGYRYTEHTAPATSEAQRWNGWGTALKPAIEPIILARKPLDGTVAGNVLAHGVGGLNIDACRVESGTDYHSLNVKQGGTKINGGNYNSGVGDVRSTVFRPSAGRFPANVLLDEHAAAEMDKQSGGASRFFPVFKYQAKAPKRERPVIEREDGTKVQHPTVKPVALMEWLVTLITPPGGTLLDPFAGSGTTLQAARDKGFHAIGVEQDPEYVKLIEHRLSRDAA